MAGDLLPRLLAAARTRRVACRAIVLAATVAAAAMIPFVPFEGSIDIMLPEDGPAREALAFLREADLASKVLVTLERDEARVDLPGLVDAADWFADGLDPSLVTHAAAGIDESLAMDEVLALAARLPQLATADDLAAIERRLAPDAVAQSLRDLQRRMLTPEGMASMSNVRADPLGLRGIVLRRLQALMASFGYRAVLEMGHLVSEDRRHALLVLDSPVSMTDASGARRLAVHLRERIASLPAGVTAAAVCGHLHTTSNEEIIRRDIRITAVAAAVSFVLLFALVFRDGRAVLIFVIPIAATAVAVPLAGGILGSLSYMVIGLGSVIAGIAVDYGIHTYIAARHAAGDPDAAVARIVRPVTLGALTTVCVFAAFLASSIGGYRQLAVFAIPAILLSLAYAVFLLPSLVRSAPPREPRAQATAKVSRGHAWALGLFIATLPAQILLATRIRFDPNVAALDGTAPEILAAERRFQQTWGGGESDLAIVAVEGEDEESALRANDRLFADGGDRATSWTSLAVLCPSRETRERRLADWRAFWTAERVESLRANLARHGEACGFVPGAFDPFLAWIASPPADPPPATDGGMLARLRTRFLRPGPGGRVRVLTFLPDREDDLAAARVLAREHPGTIVFSRKAFSQDLSHGINREVGRVSAIGAAAIVVASFLLVGRPVMAAVALVPAFMGVLWGLAVMTVLGLPLTIANLIAGIVVFGLCIDYGICKVYACQRGTTRDTATAVTLSAVTTVLGAGVLLFARHPALFSIGLTLVVGVATGYLCAIGVVPPLLARVTPVRSGGSGDAP